MLKLFVIFGFDDFGVSVINKTNFVDKSSGDGRSSSFSVEDRGADLLGEYAFSNFLFSRNSLPNLLNDASILCDCDLIMHLINNNKMPNISKHTTTTLKQAHTRWNENFPIISALDTDVVDNETVEVETPKLINSFGTYLLLISMHHVNFWHDFI